MIVSHNYDLYFPMPFLAFFLMVWHSSAYSIRCLSSPFSTISRLFDTRVRVGDGILDFSGLLIALATLDALCCIVSGMVLLNVSMSSSSCNVSNRFLNSSWNSIVFDLICVASWWPLCQKCFPFPPLRPFDVAHNHSVVTSNVDLVDN